MCPSTGTADPCLSHPERAPRSHRLLDTVKLVDFTQLGRLVNQRNATGHVDFVELMGHYVSQGVVALNSEDHDQVAG